MISKDFKVVFSAIDPLFENRYTYTPHAIGPVTPTSVIKRVKQTKACTTARHKTLLYNFLILSHINYCIKVWGYKGSRILKIQKRQFE